MVALGLNISMSLLKLLVGAMSGSLAVIADGMHSATDALSSLTGWSPTSSLIHAPIAIIPTAIANTRRSESGYRRLHPVHSHRNSAAIRRTAA